MKPLPLFRSLAAAGLGTLLSLGAFGQQTRSVGSFRQVKTSGAIDVVLTQGPSTSVRVEADSDLLPYIKTEVQDGTLRLYRTKDPSLSQLFNNRQVTVYVTCPRLEGVEASGASEVKTTAPFTAGDFRIQASGASEVNMALNAKTLTVNASGASDLRLAGRVDRQQVQLSGSSDYQGYNLQSRTAEVQASGASDAYVAVSQELTSRASGASDIHYKGKPRLVR